MALGVEGLDAGDAALGGVDIGLLGLRFPKGVGDIPLDMLDHGGEGEKVLCGVGETALGPGETALGDPKVLVT